MRNKLVISLLILFTLFMSGAGLSLLFLYNTTANLQAVINLHRVEIIRQNLVINAQTVQAHLYSFGTAFGQELDVIVDNVIELDSSAHKCMQCHHEPEIEAKLQEMAGLVEQYQDSLSYLITTSANEERVQRLKTVAISIGNSLLELVQQMAFIAGEKLNQRSIDSLQEINNSKYVLMTTLVMSFLIAIAIAVTLTRQMTEPIDELLYATRRIKAGELGYTTAYRAQGEFGELINSFNDMSMTIEESQRRLMKHINSISDLYSITLGLHAMTDESELYREIARGVSSIVGSEQAGLMLLHGDTFQHTYPAMGLDLNAVKILHIHRDEMLRLYDPSSRRAYVNNEGASHVTGSIDRALNVHNQMFVWIRQHGEITGAIRVANKIRGPFTEEDIHPLAILSNNISVALDNARLYDDLRSQMKQLKETQEQLVQAAKLVAIGELASNVAHELNNPLTTVLGYAELMKEERDIEKVISDLSVVESECLRAKEIIRQLLEFARRRELDIKRLNINATIQDIIELMRIQGRKSDITIESDFSADAIIMGDENQLKQVILNITTNAFHAMGEHGTLKIATRSEEESVLIEITNTGVQIPKDIMNRIFEPFFSTKHEKGTGLGLSISYRIIQSHNGLINVESPCFENGTGARFTIVLPRKEIPKVAA